MSPLNITQLLGYNLQQIFEGDVQKNSKQDIYETLNYVLCQQVRCQVLFHPGSSRLTVEGLCIELLFVARLHPRDWFWRSQAVSGWFGHIYHKNKEGGPAKVDGDLNLLGKPWKTQSRTSLEHVHVAIHAGLGQHPWSAGNPSLNKYVQCKSAKASAAATV